MADIALETTDLCKSYKRPERTIEVLKGISIKFPVSTFVALAGQSGCGKTTLLQLLGALDSPTSGDVVCFGKSLSDMGAFRQARLRREEIGFVFQSYQLLPEFSALENIQIAARLGKLGGAEGRQRAQELLDRVGMADRARHRPPELSGGEQQRVAIARALVNNPRIILADEPTGNLDPKNSDGIMELLRRLQEDEARTIIMVTHSKSLAAVADLTYVMENGQVHR